MDVLQWHVEVAEAPDDLRHRDLLRDVATVTRVREVLDHYGDTIVRGAYDGEYDKTKLPKELILSNYFRIQNGKIVSLVIIFNQPSPY